MVFFSSFFLGGGAVFFWVGLLFVFEGKLKGKTPSEGPLKENTHTHTHMMRYHPRLCRPPIRAFMEKQVAQIADGVLEKSDVTGQNLDLQLGSSTHAFLVCRRDALCASAEVLF